MNPLISEMCFHFSVSSKLLSSKSFLDLIPGYLSRNYGNLNIFGQIVVLVSSIFDLFDLKIFKFPKYSN